MMPRPVLRDNFNLTYRKIPVLAIGREVRGNARCSCSWLTHPDRSIVTLPQSLKLSNTSSPMVIRHCILLLQTDEHIARSSADSHRTGQTYANTQPAMRTEL